MNRIYLDLETTGKNDGLKLDEPVQIGIVDDDGNVLINQLIRPSVDIDEGATATHGYSMEHLWDAPRFVDILPTLTKHLKDKTVYIYNAAFDVRVLINAAHNAGVILPKFYYECVMLEYAAAYKMPEGSGFKAQKLSVACSQQGIERLDAHDAVTDCQMLRLLKQHLDSGGVKVFDPNAPIILTVTTIEKKKASNGNFYASFTADDGQVVNVFDSSYHLFDSMGWDIHSWMRRMSEGKPEQLKETIEIQVTLRKGFLSLIKVLEENYDDFARSMDEALGLNASNPKP